MLVHPTIESLKKLRLLSMAKALEDQINQPQIESMGFEERLGLMVDREIYDRETRKLQTRLRKAALKQEASIENIDYKASRGIDKKLILTLANCQWIKMNRNVLIAGATGTGKSYLACALAHKACLEGSAAYYKRLPRLLPELALARGDGSYGKTLGTPLSRKKTIPSLFLQTFVLVLCFLMLRANNSRLSFLNYWLRFYRIAPDTHQDQGLLYGQ